MGYTKKEIEWIKYGWFRLGVTILIYALWGDYLAEFVLSLDGLNPIAANLIVFGIIGMFVSMLVHYVDNKKI